MCKQRAFQTKGQYLDGTVPSNFTEYRAEQYSYTLARHFCCISSYVMMVAAMYMQFHSLQSRRLHKSDVDMLAYYSALKFCGVAAETSLAMGMV